MKQTYEWLASKKQQHFILGNISAVFRIEVKRADGRSFSWSTSAMFLGRGDIGRCRAHKLSVVGIGSGGDGPNVTDSYMYSCVSTTNQLMLSARCAPGTFNMPT